MADTIRDVTIRVSLKQVQGEALKVPDVDGLQKTFDRLNTTLQKLSQTGKASTTPLETGVRGVKESVEALQPASERAINTLISELKEARGDVELLRRKIKDAENSLAQMGKRSGPEVDRLRDSISGARKQLVELENKGVRSGLAVGNAMQVAGEGAFTAARGAALLFTSTDEGYQKMIRNVALVQGAFDLFKGSFQTVKGLAEAMLLLRTRTLATAAAQTAEIATTRAGTLAHAQGAAAAGAHAVANVGLTATFVALRKAAITALAFMGPKGWALIAAGIGVAWAALSLFGDEVEEVAESAEKMSAATERHFTRLSEAVAEAMGNLDLSQSEFGIETAGAIERIRLEKEMAALRKQSYSETQELEKARVQTATEAAKVEEKIKAVRQAQTHETVQQGLHQKRTLEKQLKDAENKLSAEVNSVFGGDEEEIKRLYALVKDIKRQMEEAAKTTMLAHTLVDSQEAHNLAKLDLQVAQQNLALAEEQERVHRDRLTTAQQIKATKEGELKTVKEQIAEQKKAQADQQKSFEARYAELNPAQQRKLNELARRRAAGQTAFNRQEEQLFETVGATEAAEESRASRGRQQGANAETAQALGVREADKKIKELETQRQKLETEAKLVATVVGAYSQQTAAVMQAMHDNLVPAVEAAQLEVERLRIQVDDDRRRLDASKAKQQAQNK